MIETKTARSLDHPFNSLFIYLVDSQMNLKHKSIIQIKFSSCLSSMKIYYILKWKKKWKLFKGLPPDRS